MKDVTRKWSGHWICGAADPAPCLRRSFWLERLPKRAFLHLCGLGWHELFVNGAKADDRVLAPAASQFDRHAGYISYDLTKHLKTGENVLVVLLGNGWYNCRTREVWNFEHAVWMDDPKMLCDLVCDGGTVLSSDDAWRHVPSPIVFNQLRNGEHYDAGKEIAGVLLPGFDDSSCPRARYCNPPGGKIIREEATPCRIAEKIRGKRRVLRQNVQVFDFGKTLTGWCEIEVSGKAGASVRLAYAERLLSSGDITTEHIDQYVLSGEFQTDCYTLRGGGGREAWHPRFAYHAFRYCRVTVEGEAEVHRLTAHFVRSDFAEAGNIRCSDPLVEKLLECARRSYLVNYTGIPTDCPHREKNGWTGDAQLAMELGLWNYDCAASAANFLRILIDNQRPSGQLPGIAPSSGSMYNWGSGPAWDIYLFEAPYRIWLFTGDETPFRYALPAMKRYLEYCRGMSREGGLVSFGLGDWCALDIERSAPQELTSSAYYFYAAKIISRYCPEYAAVARSVKEAINRKYYHGGGSYAENDRTSLACALYFGLSPEPEKTAALLVREVRKEKYRGGFGILGSKYIFRALSEYGYAGDAFKLLQCTAYPSFGYWVKKFHASTLHETWDSEASRAHVMFGDYCAWAYQYLAGITPLEDAPGFRRFLIKPCFVRGLDRVEAEHRSPYGLIRVKWERDGEGVALNVEVPKGSEADIVLGGETVSCVTGSFQKHFADAGA